jgi:hypothetical protein
VIYKESRKKGMEEGKCKVKDENLKMKKFFIVSLVLAATAVALHLLALQQFGRNALRRAQVVTATGIEAGSLQAEADLYSKRGTVIGYIGFALWVSSIGLVIISARRRESAPRFGVWTLQFVYLLLLFFQV